MLFVAVVWMSLVALVVTATTTVSIYKMLDQKRYCSVDTSDSLQTIDKMALIGIYTRLNSMSCQFNDQWSGNISDINAQSAINSSTITLMNAVVPATSYTFNSNLKGVLQNSGVQTAEISMLYSEMARMSGFAATTASDIRTVQLLSPASGTWSVGNNTCVTISIPFTAYGNGVSYEYALTTTPVAIINLSGGSWHVRFDLSQSYTIKIKNSTVLGSE